MPYKFQCAHCGQKISSRDDLSGAETSCPQCDKSFTVATALYIDDPTQKEPAAPRADYLDPSDIQVFGEGTCLRLALGIFFAGLFILFAFGAYQEDEEFGPAIGSAVVATPFFFFGLLGGAALVLKIQQNNLLGTSVRVTPQQFTWLHELFRTAADRLKMKMPDIYVAEGDDLNAYATGLIGRKSVVMHSKMLAEFTRDELLFVIGHELTHIKCRHTFWNALMAGEGVGGIPILSQIFKFVLLHWSRRAEYTCDRGGFIACQLPDACLSGLGKLIVGPELASDLNLSAIVEQKKELEGDVTTSWTEWLSTHPYTVNRIIALTRYIDKKA